MPNFIEIEVTFCGRTDGQTFETHFIRSTQKCQPNKRRGLGAGANVWFLGRQLDSDVSYVHCILEICMGPQFISLP